MQGFLNECSLPKFYSEEQVRNLFDDFGSSYKKARALGIKEVKILAAFYIHEFAPAYRFENWIRDPDADADLKTLLKSTFGTTPYIDDLLNQYESDHNAVLDMMVGEIKVIGIGLASDYIFNTIAFSYGNFGWDLSNYEVVISQVKEQGNEIIEFTENASARNISTLAHCELFKEFINEQALSGIENGKELWIKRNDLFPNLSFCDNVRQQISKYNLESLGFSMIIKRLFELQNVATNLNGNPVKPSDFPSKTTPESESRLKEFKKQLTFICPDGSSQLFSWHMRFTPGAGRIYFIANETQNQIIVGSISNKIT